MDHDEMRAALEALDIEWHCQSRHGVVRNVPKAEAGEVQRVLVYFFGHGCCWWTRAGRGKTRDVEFVHKTKVFPAPTKPWGWCGETLLFADWQKRLEDERSAGQNFSAGDRVEFDHLGKAWQGTFSHVTKSGKARVIVDGDGPWRVPASHLRAA